MSLRIKNDKIYFHFERLQCKKPTNMKGGHIHNRHELYYLHSGERRYFIDGEIFNLTAGDIVLIPKNTIHHTTNASAKPYERYLINFNSFFLQEETENVLNRRYFKLNSYECSELLTLFKKIENEGKRNDALQEAVLKSYMTELFALLIRSDTQNEVHTFQKSQTESIVENAAQYINIHLSDPLTLTSVAELFHLSAPYFSRIFKSCTGFGFIEYLTHLRIKKATQLLLGTSAQISEIAEMCGFADSNYFSSTFKKIMGTPPKKYRSL